MPARRITQQHRDAIVASIQNGAYLKDAAIAAGIGRQFVYSEMRENPDFKLAVDQARATATDSAVQIIRAAAHTDWRAAAWFLERTRPKDFQEQRQVEVSGELTLEQVLFDSPSEAIEGHAEEILAELAPPEDDE